MKSNTDKNINRVKLPADVIEFEGEKYQWQRQTFRLPGDQRTYTREDALTDQGVLRALLSINGQGVLRQLV